MSIPAPAPSAERPVPVSRVRVFPFALAFLVATAVAPLAAQTIPQRGQVRAGGSAAPKPRTLAIRESALTMAVDQATATYRQEEGSSAFLLESVEGQTTLAWKVGETGRPLFQNAQPPARVVEKRVKFLPHGDQLFVRIETVSKGTPGREEEGLRFSGTYEATVLEGSLEESRQGGVLKARLADSDQTRYLEEVRKATFGPEVLAAHANHFRDEMLAVLERKLADPGETPAREIDLVRHLVAFVKAHPESFVVTVSPSFEAEPEIFVVHGKTLRSTTARQATTLRFDAKLPAVGAAPAP